MRAGGRARFTGVVVLALAAPAGLAGTANASSWKSPSLSVCYHDTTANDLWRPFAPTSRYQKPQYRMDAGGFVHLRGSVACPISANATQLFVLPVRFRPLENEEWMIASGDGGGNFDAYPDIDIIRKTGQVLFQGVTRGYSGAFVSLAGIEFAHTQWPAAGLKPCASGSSWTSVSGSKVSFVRDSDGVVHLRGRASCNNAAVSSRVILTLPKADRPARAEVFTVVEGGGVDAAVVEVDPNGAVGVGGNVGPYPIVSLSGIAFNAAGAHTSGSWRTPTLAACWQPFGHGYQPPRFRLDSRGFVHLSGALACPSATNIKLFKLPSRLAPPAKEVFPIATGNGFGSFDEGAVIQVNPDGTVTASGTFNWSFISLSPIEFAAG